MLKVNIFDELSWKLPKLQDAKIESCQYWKLPKLKFGKVESDFSISCLKLVFLINWIENCRNWKWFQYVFLMNWMENFPNWNLAKFECYQLKVTEIESCQN